MVMKVVVTTCKAPVKLSPPTNQHPGKPTGALFMKSRNFGQWYDDCMIGVWPAIAIVVNSSLNLRPTCSCCTATRKSTCICFVVLVMRKGGESSWSGPWHLVCTLEVFHVHSYQDQFIQPGWAECVFGVFSLGLYFVYSLMFIWFVLCPHHDPFMFPWAAESSPLQFLALV